MCKFNPIFLAFLRICATIIAYLPALDARYIWDDDDYVTENQTLRSIDGLRRIWLEPTSIPQYYPLVHSTFWVEFHFWKLKPFGYHLVNILLHLANALLLWRVLLGLKVPGAMLAGFIFALHPVHVESVAWITERKNVLSALFFFLSLLAWLRYDPLVSESRDNETLGRRKFYVLRMMEEKVTRSPPSSDMAEFAALHLGIFSQYLGSS